MKFQHSLKVLNTRGKKNDLKNQNGCASPIEFLSRDTRHVNDRDRSTTQTASLIAASFQI